MSVSRVGEWSVLGVSAGGDDAVGSVVVPFGVSELSRPVLIGAAQSVDLDHPSGIGSATHRVQRVLATGLSASSVYLTNSATSALEILAIAFRELGYSRAIVPSFAHVADASAFALHGYRIQFADVGDDLLIDPSSVAALEPDERTVVLAVHYAGRPCNMQAITELCGPRGSLVVEDLAHSFGCRFRRQCSYPAGSAGAVSFQLQKEVTCGEGGAVALFDPELEQLVRRIRDRGTNRHEFEEGSIPHYTWVSHGSAFAPSEITASILERHIDRCETPIGRRRTILKRYVTELSEWASDVDASLPTAAMEYGAVNTMFVHVNGERERQSLADHLRHVGVASATHFPPLHRSRMARRLGASQNSCPGADRAFAGLLRLPLHSSLTDAQVELVVQAVREWHPSRSVCSVDT